MCDYSLMVIPNRLAEEGEELVTHRFWTGSLGFASPLDMCKAALPLGRRLVFWPMPLEHVFLILRIANRAGRVQGKWGTQVCLGLWGLRKVDVGGRAP